MIAAYCWPQSGKANEKIALYCHTEADSFQIEVIRQGAVDDRVLTESGIPGQAQTITDTLAADGCDWDQSYEITIDPDWSAGFYLLRLQDSDGNTADAFFVVRQEQPAEAMLVLSTSTWNAYNVWGGLSYYTGGYVVSPMRPLQPGFLTKGDPYMNRIARFKEWTPEDRKAYFGAGYDPWTMAAGWSNWELLFVQWAEQQGYNLNYAVSQDLDQFPDLLDGHPAYISVGHDEYWSAGMRDTVENYIDAGGNAAFFSANTSFWQVRFSDDYRQMTSYKCQIKDDPVYNPDSAPSLATMWSDPLVGRPESQMTGVSFTRGGYAHMPNAPDGTGGYTICHPDHWVFADTNLKSGDTLGDDDVIVGYECDGCEFKFEDGKFVPTYEDDTPEGFEILGIAPTHLWETEEAPGNLADNYIGELNWVAERIGGADTPENRERFTAGHAVMGTFKRGKGQVFTSGSTDWAYGLRDSQVSKVTNNVLTCFIKGE
ncbi:MAG: hypothetical protein O3B72_02505 [Proteobacteria bacterium]|jgi:hypothetical protein|nr:hypothetical protein [Pseudomonadota bacterium]